MRYVCRTFLWSAGLLLILCSAASAQYAITQYSDGFGWPGGASGIAAGPDGALWFTVANLSLVGRITVSGAVTTYFIGPTPYDYGEDIVADRKSTRLNSSHLG